MKHTGRPWSLLADQTTHKKTTKLEETSVNGCKKQN